MSGRDDQPVSPTPVDPIDLSLLVPGGILATDHMHAPGDETCSRCRRSIPDDEVPLLLSDHVFADRTEDERDTIKQRFVTEQAVAGAPSQAPAVASRPTPMRRRTYCAT